MKMRFLCGVLLFVIGCSGNKEAEQQAERMMVVGRDLEVEMETLPKAIVHYGEVVAKFPNTEAGKNAKKRQQELQDLQELLAADRPKDQDSLVVYYEKASQVAPGYFALLKKLGTIYYNQSDLFAISAAKTKVVSFKEAAVKVWNKQDQLWQTYDFRPDPADRFWQDKLCQQAIGVTEMLIHKDFAEFDRASEVIQRGLHYGNSEDIRSKAKVVAAFCAFRKGKKENLQTGIHLAEEALDYEFLPEEDRARAFHVIGLCYTYLHQESGEMADLDAAIQALNECLNIDKSMVDARDLLKTLRQIRENLPS